MRRSVTAACVALAVGTTPARAHAIFPGQQTVLTGGDRAFVKFQASNARKDVSEFAVEVFDGRGWSPSRVAVPFPPRLTVRAAAKNMLESSNRPFSVLVDLDGKLEQRIRVCTKSIAQSTLVRPNVAQVNTRVCANVTVRRIAP